MQIPVVYTMGKVGSTALTSAIQAAGLACFDIHTLDVARIDRLVNRKITQKKQPERHLIESMSIHKMVKENPQNFCFITAVREPVGQAISAYFQNLDLFLPELDPRDISQLQKTIDVFLEKYDLSAPLNWFDSEFRDLLSIDVLSERYSASDFVIEERGVRLLTLRVDWSNEKKQRLVSEFIGRPVELRRENEAASKKYGELYREFVNDVRFQPTVLKEIYDTRYCSRFWTPEERSVFCTRWANGMSAAQVGKQT